MPLPESIPQNNRHFEKKDNTEILKHLRTLPDNEDLAEDKLSEEDKKMIEGLSDAELMEIYTYYEDMSLRLSHIPDFDEDDFGLMEPNTVDPYNRMTVIEVVDFARKIMNKRGLPYKGKRENF